MVTEIEAALQEAAAGNRILAFTGLAAGSTASRGHVSVRDPARSDRFWVKGRGYEVDALESVRPADLVLCDLEGNLLEGPPGVSPCYEVALHAAIYQVRSDVSAIVHAHPRHTVLLSVQGIPIRPVCQEGLALVAQPLPVFPGAELIQDFEVAGQVSRLLGGSPALLLKGHGAVTVGASVGEAVLRMIWLEEQAKLNWQGLCAFGPGFRPLTEDEVEAVLSQRPVHELPHFKSLPGFVRQGADPTWAYLKRAVRLDRS